MSDTPPEDQRTHHELLAELADEFAARYRRGEQPTIAEYVRNHPALAAEIRDAFPALIAMEQQLETGPGMDPMPTEQVGAVIGRYKLLERLGEGGFGIVFMAEQQFPVRRKVALKLIKPGVDTRQVIARFEAERQALALMEHENIARVLDAGATDAGRPYFVMELVRGVPITAYCDRNRLAPRARLELFVQICRAVQHAHTKGVIHRDIKPGNVLVTLNDGRPVPKVIDFGVAKATGQQLTEKTLFTHFAQIVGTPLYMSPEQAEMSGLDVDTRTDVYSLGVLLYELLTGSTPLDRDRLRQAAFHEVIRIIREEEPPRPSTRLSTAAALPSIAACRGLEPGKLSGLMRGELDWIVMKCLEKDRIRRYETVNGLAMDVDRYLKDETVQACPPSRSYRLRKFARRNKGGLLIASAGLAALVLLMVGLAVSNFLIAAQRNEKAEALRQKEKALALATAESDRSKKNFMAASIAIREVITKAALGAEGWAQLPPALRGKMSEEAIKFYSSLLQEDSPDPNLRYETGVGYRSIALLHERSGDSRRAEACYRKSIDILEAIRIEAPGELQYRQQLGYSLYMLAGCLVKSGQAQAADGLYRRSADLYAALVSAAPNSYDFRNNLAQCLVAWQRISETVPHKEFLDGPGMLSVQRARADLLASLGQTAEAGKAYHELASEYRKLAASGPAVSENKFQESTCEFRSGQLLVQDGRAAEAERAYLRSIALLGRLAEEFPKELKYRKELGRSRNWLGLLLSGSARGPEAEQEHRHAAAIYADLVELADPLEGHWHRRELVWSRLNLGCVLENMKRGPEAEAQFREALEMCEARRNDAGRPPATSDASYTQWSRDLSFRIGLLCGATNRREEARKWFEKASVLAGADPAAHQDLADRFARQGLLAEARTEAREAIRLQPDLAGAHYRLCQVLLAEGDRAGALAELAALDRLLEQPGIAESLTAGSGEARGHLLWDVGNAWLQLDRPAEAEQAIVRALATFQQLEAKYPANRYYRQEQGFSHRLLANVAERTGRTGDAEGHLRHALSWYQRLAAEAPDSTFYRQEEAVVHRALANLLRAGGRTAEARQAMQSAISQFSAILASRPEEVDVRRERGRCHLEEAEFDKALEDFSALIRMRPGVSWYWCDRGFTYLRRGEHEKAIADLSKAISLADAVTERIMRGEACRALGRWHQAELDFSRAIELRPDWDSWQRRGQLYAELGRWEEAAADLSKAAKSAPDLLSSYHLALVCLARQDVPGYGKICAALLSRAEKMPDLDSAFWTAWTCVLAPDAGVDTSRVLRLAERATGGDSKRADFLAAHGAALYRAGRYEEAIERLAESEAAFARNPGGGTVIYTQLFLAMAHQRLENRQAARRWLESAVRSIEHNAPTTRPTTAPARADERWNRRLTARLLQAEAEALLAATESKTGAAVETQPP